VVIAIDGPAGSGKSTVARELARRLGFIYIDTGAMYRGVALLALRNDVALDDATALERIAAGADFRFVRLNGQDRLFAKSEDITDLIRTPAVAQSASVISTIAGVRREMVARQREMGRDGNVVMEGRDIGTVVFPDAKIKVFLSASPEERARRRYAETPGGGSLDTVSAQIIERDARDSQRDVAPLRPAADAVVIDSTGLSLQQVIEQIEKLAGF
jgi:cytidylate kinase